MKNLMKLTKPTKCSTLSFLKPKLSQFLPTLALLMGALLPGVASAADAEIVMVQGRVEVRDQASGIWRPAITNQSLEAGQMVRTGDASQMALLIKDKTQVRLNQQSLFQIKTAGDGQGGTELELTQGRMWAQAKQFLTGFLRGATSVVSAQRRLTVSTPTSTIGIRGTDWEVSVGDAGTTTVAVFSGEVAVSNALGEVSVLPSEQATVEAGKAPVKRVLANATDRVQWVTALRVDPMRYADFASSDVTRGVRDALAAGRNPEARAALLAALGSSKQGPDEGSKMTTTAPSGSAVMALPEGAWLMAADFALVAGETQQADAHLADGVTRFPSDDRFPAAQARAALLRGDSASARRIANAANAKFTNSTELALVLGELSRLDGDGAAALAQFDSAVRSKPDDARGWTGKGITLSEQENFDPARAALQRAIALAPKQPGALAELGALETRANQLPPAAAAIDSALALAPDDYVAWTSRGILLLTQGNSEAALQALLKAGLLEPRYAKAQIYTAIAWYQQGREDAALAALQRAKKADPNDPLPYFYEAQIQRDALNPMAAITAAREALARFPFLKSLGPIATDRQGNANLGAGYALFGLESWAKRISQQTQHPFFAGSYLFEAERSTQTFNKNSALLQGYLTDPTLFGASPQRSTLMAAPGGYLAAQGQYVRSNKFSQPAIALIANGYAVNPFPISGFIQYDGQRVQAGDVKVDADAASVTAAIGFKPSADWGVFLYRDEFRPHFDHVPVATTDDRISGRVVRTDLGASWKINPTSALWLRAGMNSDNSDVNSNVKNLANNGRAAERDSGIRFTQINTTGEWTLGAGQGHGDKTQITSSVGTRSSSAITDERSYDGDHVFGSWKGARGEWKFQGDLNYGTYRVNRGGVASVVLLPSGRDIGGPLPSSSDDKSLTSPSFGVAWSPSAGTTYRFAWQDQMRPAAATSLAPLNTVGISLDVPGWEAGGRLKRQRLQGEWELGEANYLTAFLDKRDIRNVFLADGTLFVDTTSLAAYDRLRQQSPVRGDLPEALESRSAFPAGKMRLAGLAFEKIASSDWSWSASYVHAQTDNEIYPLVPLPAFPEHTLSFGLTWFAPERWVIHSRLTGRSERTLDAQGTQLLDPDWDFSLNATWQDAAKRKLIELYANGLFRKDDTAAYGIRGVWRY